MSLLDYIARIAGLGHWVTPETTNAPGWRHPGYKMKKSRRPFSSDRKREPGKQEMHVEEFTDKTLRDARFQELRAAGTPNVTKYSMAHASGSRWYVVRP